MCDHLGRPVAWLDREMQTDEAAKMERHVAECAECRNCAAEMERVSGAFEEYCDAYAQSSKGRKEKQVAPIWGAAAAAVLLAAIVVYPRRHDAALTLPPSMTKPVQTVSSNSVTSQAAESISAPLPNDHHTTRRLGPHGKASAAFCAPPEMQSRNESWVAEEPSVQIAIPSEAMFPPGAVPEGVNFVADVSIGADGAAEQLRLRPRPARFERRTDQP